MALTNIAMITTNLTCLEDVLQLPELTNNMYFDVLNLLHRIFSLQANAVKIISNPGYGSRPCCFIVTKDQTVLQQLRPLATRWPDRFITEAGLVGALTAGEDIKRELVAKTDLNPSVQSQSIENARLVAKLFRAVIDVNVATVAENEDSLRVATAAHILEFAVRRWSESILDSLKAADEQTDSAIENSGIKRRPNVTRKLAEIRDFVRTEDERRSWMSELINAIYRRNKFTVRLKSFNFDQGKDIVSNRYQCRVEATDYLNDVVILAFDKKIKANDGLNSWIIGNTRRTSLAKRSARIGDVCSSPAFAAQSLRIESTDESVFIPLADKVVRMHSVIVLSGAEGKIGTSGSPIYDKSGSVVAMTIGKTIMDAVSLILAIPFSSESSIAKLLSHKIGPGTEA